MQSKLFSVLSRPGQASVVLVAILCSALIAGCGKPAEPGAVATQAPPPALPVTVLVAEPRLMPVVIEAVGRAEGSREVEIRARVTGVLQRQVFREGEAVRAGDVLFAIDPAPFEIAVAQARAQLAQEQARLDRLQLEARRLRGLVEERAVSQREYDDIASASKQAQAAVQSAEARVREAELNLSYTTVRAPIAGITGRALRSEGSLVTAGTEAGLLTTLVRADPVWVRFSLSDDEHRQLRAAKRPGKVRLVMPGGEVFPAAGRLNFAASTVDPRLGTVQLRAEFDNPALGLLPGQYVRARLEVGEKEGVLLPQQAVLQNEQGSFVWVVGPEDKAVPRPVQAANWVGRDWMIRAGLKSGDQVIIDNLLKVRPGAAVQPKPPAAEPASTGSAAPTAGRGQAGGAATR